ncbi:hypothetical protein DFJ73DRAFT_872401 [Zopfochytrium polystomum]|nr:hypothetical protein DFJ73DRAFT_872401 [Zopfochytrium polystomum]
MAAATALAAATDAAVTAIKAISVYLPFGRRTTPGNFSSLPPHSPTLKFLASFWIASRYSRRGLARAAAKKHVLVVGASKGLGKSVATELASAGARTVTILARGKAALDLAADEILREAKAAGIDNSSVRIRTVAVDASSTADLVEKLRPVYREAGRPDWVFACAGAARPGYSVDQADPAAPGGSPFESMMTQNYATVASVVRACLLLAKDPELLKLLVKPEPEEPVKKNKAGPTPGKRTWLVAGVSADEQALLPSKIVIVGSMLSIISFCGYAAYSSSKFALRGLADALRSELKPLGVSVHMYYPTNVDTPGFAEENKGKPAITAQLEGADAPVTAEDAAKKLLSQVVVGRYQIAGDFLGELLRVVANGCAPRPNPVTEAIALPLVSMVGTAWVWMADLEISNYFSRPRPVQTKKTQ